MSNKQYLHNPPSLRTPDGTLVMLSKRLREELGVPVGSILGHDKENMTSKVKLMEPKRVEKCARCGGPVRMNRTTGVATCRDFDSCNHSHGFVPTSRVVAVHPTDYSVMRDE